MAAKRIQGGCLVLIVLFWNGITGVFNGLLIRGVYHQLRTENFRTTEGVIRHSKVTVNRDSDGNTYGIEVRYEYQVGGRKYEADRYRYGQMSSGDDHAKRVVKSLPVGKRVEVFYDPEDPGEAVLLQEVQGSDLFLANFLVPFNVIGLSLLILAVRAWLRGGRPAEAGGLRVKRGPFQTQVRRSVWFALLMAGITASAVAFVSIFAIGFGKGFHPPREWMEWLWTGNFSLASFVFCTTFFSGDLLVIDSRLRCLILPTRRARAVERQVPFDQITRIEIEEARADSSGGGGSQAVRYNPVVVFNDGWGERRQTLIRKMTDENARSFVNWLKAELGRGV